MTKKEFKTALFSYCQSLGYIITKHSVEFKLFGTLFYFSPYDGSFNYAPIPIPTNEEEATLSRIRTNYTEEALELCKHIAKDRCMIYKGLKIKEKLKEINKDFV